MIYFAHIPKCGGKSVLSSLQDIYGERLVIYYSNPLKRSRSGDWAHRWRRRIFPRHYMAFSGNECEIVYGHYCFDDFKSECSNKRNSMIAFFRDPIEWAGSYIFYTVGKYPDTLSSDYVTSARRLNLDRGYRAFLGGFNVEDLACVGIVEDFEGSMMCLERFLGHAFPRRHVNKTSKPDGISKYRDVFEQNGSLLALTGLMQENYDIYCRARELFSIQMEMVRRGSPELPFPK